MNVFSGTGITHNRLPIGASGGNYWRYHFAVEEGIRTICKEVLQDNNAELVFTTCEIGIQQQIALSAIELNMPVHVISPARNFGDTWTPKYVKNRNKIFDYAIAKDRFRIIEEGLFTNDHLKKAREFVILHSQNLIQLYEPDFLTNRRKHQVFDIQTDFLVQLRFAQNKYWDNYLEYAGICKQEQV